MKTSRGEIVKGTMLKSSTGNMFIRCVGSWENEAEFYFCDEYGDAKSQKDRTKELFFLNRKSIEDSYWYIYPVKHRDSVAPVIPQNPVIETS